MTKKNKIILITIVSVLLVIIGVLISTLILTPETKPQDEETNITTTSKNEIVYGSSLVLDSVPTYTNAEKVFVFSCSPIDKDMEDCVLIDYIVYADCTLTVTETYKDNMIIHTYYKISNEQLKELQNAASNVKNTEISEKCSDGYNYVFKDVKNNKEFNSCNSCLSDVFDICKQVKRFIAVSNEE